MKTDEPTKIAPDSVDGVTRRLQAPRRRGHVYTTSEFTIDVAQRLLKKATRTERDTSELVFRLDERETDKPSGGQRQPGAMSPQEASIVQKMLDAMPVPHLLLDETYVISTVNQLWHTVYEDIEHIDASVGLPYFAVCQKLLPPPVVLQIVQGMQSVKSGERDVFRLVTSPEDSSLLARISVTRLTLENGVFLMVEHGHERRSHEHQSSTQRGDTFLQHIVEQSSELSFVLPTPGRHITYVSPAIERVLGYQESELTNKHLDHLIHKDDLPLWEAACDKAHGSRTPVPVQLRCLHQDGTWRTMVGLLRDQSDVTALGGLLLNLRDETKTTQLQEQVFLAQRLADTGRLASSVGHEINNSLSYIISNIDVILSRLPQAMPAYPETGSTYALLSEAYAGIQHISTVARELTDFGRPKTLKVSAVDIHAVLKAVLKRTQNELQHKALLSLQLEGTPLVRGCHHQLEQVFLNLILNAVQQMPAGAAHNNIIRISTYVDQTHPQYLVAEIEDSGHGIASHQLPHIFSPYYSNRNTGVGLGLFVCHRIMTQMGGSIDVASVPKQGSTFIVRLPLAEASLPRHPQIGALPPRRQQLSPVSDIKRILIIDDDPRVARALKQHLSHYPEVITTSDGDKAIELCMEHFDVIFCDLLMSKRSGMEIYFAAGAMRPACQEHFIFMSGGAFTDQARTFIETRTTCPLLEKPFRREQIKEVLKVSLRRRSN